MIEYIKGVLTDSSPSHVVIETHGIGHKFSTPLNNYTKFPQAGKEILLFICTVIREDAHKSYGFLSRMERDFFEKLIDVSGIGPKTALALIGHMELSDLQLAIAQSNAAVLSKVPGIGKKTAERLIVELKDKTSKLSDLTSAALPGKKDLFSDALHALVHLGYQPLQAQKAVKQILAQSETEPDLASLITAALRVF
ncbi:MAG: Holliday junction branch migration protein RuvA [Chlamydiae bacterium]|nr:Holliday junction branch migration protein RuvA [Chlamydiota bacterium]